MWLDKAAFIYDRGAWI